MEKYKEEDLKYCPKCNTVSISIFKQFVQCQNLNCLSIFRKKDYLKFLEYWENLDHSLDVIWEKLKINGKKIGLDYSNDFENIEEIGYLDAIAYSFDNKLVQN